jgi:Ca2+-binding EF-hand superfamily protein
MIEKIEKELVKYDTEIVSKLNFDHPNLEEKVTIQELENTLRVIRDHPNDERISKIIAKLDSDNDGLVAMHEIRALAEKSEKSEKQEEKSEEPKPEEQGKVSNDKKA